MPAAGKIPDTLVPLLQLQAVTLTNDSWRRDMPRLLRSIDRILARGAPRDELADAIQVGLQQLLAKR